MGQHTVSLQLPADCIDCCLLRDRFLAPVSPQTDGDDHSDNQLLIIEEVVLIRDLKRMVKQLASTAWQDDDLPIPEVSWSLQLGTACLHGIKHSTSTVGTVTCVLLLCVLLTGGFSFMHCS